MSKKYRKKKQRRSFPWPLVVFGGILLIAAAFLFSNQGGGGGTPSIAVDQQKIDYGDVKFNTQKTFAIKVTNTGDGALRFKEDPYIEVVEGCWPPQLTIGSMVLKPGESTVVESSVFMMHEGMDGPHNFAIHLKTNDPNHSDLVVNVLSNWIP